MQLKLDDRTRSRLMALRHGPGYEDLLDVMQKLCEICETKCLQLDRANGATAEQVLSAQDQARSYRAFFEEVQKEILEQEAFEIERRNTAAAAGDGSEQGAGEEGEHNGQTV